MSRTHSRYERFATHDLTLRDGLAIERKLLAGLRSAGRLIDRTILEGRKGLSPPRYFPFFSLSAGKFGRAKAAHLSLSG